MKVNFREQLIAEWYELRGYFVRTNEKWPDGHGRRRSEDMDVLALCPTTRKLIHIETTSSEYKNWVEKYRGRKFHSDDSFYMENFHADSVQRVAIVGSGAGPNDNAAKKLKDHNITLQSFGQLYEEIEEKIRDDWWPETKKAIPETLPILKGIQYALRYQRCAAQQGKDRRH